MKVFRLLALYSSDEEIKAAVFVDEASMCECTIPLRSNHSHSKAETQEAARSLLAFLDKEGINISKLGTVCTLEASGNLKEAGIRLIENKYVGWDERKGDKGAIIATEIAEALNITCYLVPAPSGEVSAFGWGKNYPGDPLLLYTAKKMLSFIQEELQ